MKHCRERKTHLNLQRSQLFSPASMTSSRSCSVQLSVEVNHLSGVHKARYLEKVELASLKTDPYLLPPSTFTVLIKSPTLPEFTNHDLYHYVVNNVSPYTGADLKAYKSLDAYQSFTAGWVTETQSYCYSRGTRFLIMAKVHHTLSAAVLKPWVSVQRDGTVLCGHCTCTAGLGEVCSHITALLYALESAVKLLEDRTCTDGPRQRGIIPVKAGTSLYEEGSGIDLSNSAKKHFGPNNKKYTRQPRKKKMVSAAAEKFYRDLDKAAQTPSEKSALLSILPEYCNQFRPNGI